MEAQTFRFSFAKKYLETAPIFPFTREKIINIF